MFLTVHKTVDQSINRELKGDTFNICTTYCSISTIESITILSRESEKCISKVMNLTGAGGMYQLLGSLIHFTCDINKDYDWLC